MKTPTKATVYSLIVGLAAGVPIGATITAPAPRVIETRPRDVVKIPADATHDQALALMNKAADLGAIVHDYRVMKPTDTTPTKPPAAGDVKPAAK